MPTFAPVKPGKREKPKHQTYCWSESRWGGECEDCGYRAGQYERHRGVCPECAGQMRCREKRKMANGRCRKHGGTNVPGPESNAFKHGRYSKYRIDPAAAKRLWEAEQDPELLSLSPEVSYLETRIGELLANIDTFAQPESWKAVGQLAREIDKAVRCTDTDSAIAATQLLIGLSDDEEHRGRTHREIDRLADRKRKLAESQRKSLLEAGELIRTTQVMLLLDQLMSSITSHLERMIDDASTRPSEVLESVWGDFRRLVGEPTQREGSGVDPGSEGPGVED